VEGRREHTAAVLKLPKIVHEWLAHTLCVLAMQKAVQKQRLLLDAMLFTERTLDSMSKATLLLGTYESTKSALQALTIVAKKHRSALCIGYPLRLRPLFLTSTTAPFWLLWSNSP
jgi:hypothetical protein